jgi:hypothetical protein
MGIVEVASLAARVTDGPEVTMVSTLRRTSPPAARRGELGFLRCGDIQSQYFSPPRIRAREDLGEKRRPWRRRRTGRYLIRILFEDSRGLLCLSNVKQKESKR